MFKSFSSNICAMKSTAWHCCGCCCSLRRAARLSLILYVSHCCAAHWKHGAVCLRPHKISQCASLCSVSQGIVLLPACVQVNRIWRSWLQGSSAVGLHFAHSEDSLCSIWCFVHRAPWKVSSEVILLFKRYLVSYFLLCSALPITFL